MNTNLNKETAIMELIDNKEEFQTLENCVMLLEQWKELADLAKPLKEKMAELSSKTDDLLNAAVEGEFDIGKTM